MEKNALRRADLVTSIILMVLAVLGIVLSVPLMSDTIRKGEPFYKSAGLFPIVICTFLGLCAISLFSKARKDGARFDFFKAEKAIATLKSREFKIAGVIIGLLALYIFVLLPLMPYSIATVLFLILFMLYFKGTPTKKSVLIILIISVIATAILTYGFGELAMIPLP